MEEQNGAGKPKSIFDSLAEKLATMQKNGSNSGSAVLKPAKSIKASDLEFMTAGDEKIRQATAIIPKAAETSQAEPVKNMSELKSYDFIWVPPFHIYGRMLRKDGAGFGDKDITAVLNKLCLIRPDLEDLAARKEAINDVIQEGRKAAIEAECASKSSSEIEKAYKLAKLSEKGESFLHYLGACYVGLWIAGSGSLQGQQPLENGTADGETARKMYDLLIDMARSSFIMHNRDFGKPKDKDSTKEEDAGKRDSANDGDLERMCGKDGPAYEVFQKTIVELVGLFARQFSVTSPTSRRLYCNTLHSRNMPDLILSLGSRGLTDPLLKIEYFSKF